MLCLELLVHRPLAKRPHQKILNIVYLRGNSIRGSIVRLFSEFFLIKF
jgi:hypothetical protein